MMWHWGGGGIHWWGWFVGFILTVGFWALFIFLIVSFARSFAAKGHAHLSEHEDPERILARRFASGEIDEEEFHRRLNVIRSRAPEQHV